jgi:GNAT superfamily N-acetyltransferase
LHSELQQFILTKIYPIARKGQAAVAGQVVGDMIRPIRPDQIKELYEIINDGARVYQGVIPVDCWQEPYMSLEELRGELAAGVEFWGCNEAGRFLGVMGRQDCGKVILIRHAYVLRACQQQGIGSRLLEFLRSGVDRPILVGTWAAAWWAVRFYEKHGFTLVTPQEKDRLLQTYWHITDRQRETSVVLGDEWWFDYNVKNTED